LDVDVIEGSGFTKRPIEGRRRDTPGSPGLVERIADAATDRGTAAATTAALMTDLAVTKANESSAGENDPRSHAGFGVGRRDAGSD
jgi:hypothetical protein